MGPTPRLCSIPRRLSLNLFLFSWLKIREANKLEKEEKKLTGSTIIQRVRGCGEIEANATLDVLKISDEKLQDAYEQGAGAVLSLLDEETDRYMKAVSVDSI